MFLSSSDARSLPLPPLSRLTPRFTSVDPSQKPREAPKEEKKKKEKAPEPERKPLQHDEPTSDEWAAGGLGRPAGALETKDWGDTIFTKPQ